MAECTSKQAGYLALWLPLRAATSGTTGCLTPSRVWYKAISRRACWLTCLVEQQDMACAWYLRVSWPILCQVSFKASCCQSSCCQCRPYHSTTARCTRHSLSECKRSSMPPPPMKAINKTMNQSLCTRQTLVPTRLQCFSFSSCL